MNIFDIIGPVMVGPSSSHTAGALRIASIAKTLVGENVKKSIIKFHGSFASTYRGHGTDKAVVAGLLGFSIDDVRIRDSLKLASEMGMEYRIETTSLDNAHPNTVVIELEGETGKKVSITGSSIGGGNVVIKRINNLEVEFTGQYYTLIVQHYDKPGVIAMVTTLLGENEVNIAAMRVYRSYRGGIAFMVIETDQEISEELVSRICHQPGVIHAAGIKSLQQEED